MPWPARPTPACGRVSCLISVWQAGAVRSLPGPARCGCPPRRTPTLNPALRGSPWRSSWISLKASIPMLHERHRLQAIVAASASYSIIAASRFSAAHFFVAADLKSSAASRLQRGREFPVGTTPLVASRQPQLRSNQDATRRHQSPLRWRGESYEPRLARRASRLAQFCRVSVCPLH